MNLSQKIFHSHFFNTDLIKWIYFQIFETWALHFIFVLVLTQHRAQFQHFFHLDSLRHKFSRFGNLSLDFFIKNLSYPAMLMVNSVISCSQLVKTFSIRSSWWSYCIRFMFIAKIMKFHGGYHLTTLDSYQRDSSHVFILQMNLYLRDILKT